MKLALAKKVELTGIDIELTTVSDGLRSIKLTDQATGRTFVIERGESYNRNLDLYEVQTHEDRDIWEVTFAIGDTRTVKPFEAEGVAQGFLRGLRDKGIDASIKKITRRVPVGTPSVDAPVTAEDDLPF